MLLVLLFFSRFKRVYADWVISDADQKLGNGKERVRLLNKAARIDPTNPRVWWKLCEGYQFTNELNLAIAACNQNIKLHPNDGLSYNSLGLAYMASKDYAAAADAFETAVAKSPRPEVYGNYVWALRSSGQYEKAVATSERMLEVSANDVSETRSALQTLTGAYLAVHQYEKATSAMERLVELDANDSTEQTLALEYLGAVYALAGQTTKAQEVFERVRVLNPKLVVKTCEITGDREKGFGIKCNSSHSPSP